MNTISDVLQSLTDSLNATPALKKAAFVTEYPARYKNDPLTQPTVTVGLSSLDLDAGGFGGFLGLDPTTGNDITGQRVCMGILLTCFFPRSWSGSDAYCLITAIAQTLTDEELGNGFSSLQVEPITYEQQTSVCHANLRLKLHTVLSSQKNEPQVEDFRVIRRT